MSTGRLSGWISSVFFQEETMIIAAILLVASVIVFIRSKGRDGLRFGSFVAALFGLIYLGFITTLSIGFGSHGTRPNRIEPAEQSTYTANKVELEDEANDLYNKLLKEISTDVASDAQDGTSVAVYPDNYGGAYLGEDGTLVVCMTADKWGRNLLKLDKVFEATDRYTVKTVPYSLNQLKRAHRELMECKLEYSDLYSPDSAEYKMFSSITGFSTDQMANTVHVNVRDISAEKRQLFNQIFGDSAGMYSIREAGQTIELTGSAG